MGERVQRRFGKYQGLGNDFIVVDGRDGPLGPFRQAAQALCDRHLGVGADGVLFVDFDGERPRMGVINADGSVPEMCGNGLRCVALHLARTAGMVDAFTVDTDAGPHRCEQLADGRLSIEMRAASLVPAEIGIAGGAPWLDAPFVVGDETLAVTAVSMGNPHAVLFDERGDDAAFRGTFGPLIGGDARFTHGVNVGFARCRGRRDIRLDVHERGVGWTQACGTGACAAAVAAVETGRADRGTPVAVTLPGGTLEITVGAPGRPLRMTGPAVHVFDGNVSL